MCQRVYSAFCSSFVKCAPPHTQLPAASPCHPLHCSKHHLSPWKFPYIEITLPTFPFAGDACAALELQYSAQSIYAVVCWSGLKTVERYGKQLVKTAWKTYPTKYLFYYKKDLDSTFNVSNPHLANNRCELIYVYVSITQYHKCCFLQWGWPTYTCNLVI